MGAEESDGPIDPLPKDLRARVNNLYRVLYASKGEQVFLGLFMQGEYDSNPVSRKYSKFPFFEQRPSPAEFFPEKISSLGKLGKGQLIMDLFPSKNFSFIQLVYSAHRKEMEKTYALVPLLEQEFPFFGSILREAKKVNDTWGIPLNALAKSSQKHGELLKRVFPTVEDFGVYASSHARGLFELVRGYLDIVDCVRPGIEDKSCIRNPVSRRKLMDFINSLPSREVLDEYLKDQLDFSNARARQLYGVSLRPAVG